MLISATFVQLSHDILITIKCWLDDMPSNSWLKTVLKIYSSNIPDQTQMRYQLRWAFFNFIINILDACLSDDTELGGTANNLEDKNKIKIICNGLKKRTENYRTKWRQMKHSSVRKQNLKSENFIPLYYFYKYLEVENISKTPSSYSSHNNSVRCVVRRERMTGPVT